MKRLAVLSAAMLVACTSSTPEPHRVRLEWSQPEGNSLNFYLAGDEAGPFVKLDNVKQDGNQLSAEVPSNLANSKRLFLKACSKPKGSEPESCSPPVSVGQ